MTAFLIERLLATGWRRTGELYWRFSDAERAGRSAISDDLARGFRVLPVRIESSAVLEILTDDASPDQEASLCSN